MGVVPIEIGVDGGFDQFHDIAKHARRRRFNSTTAGLLAKPLLLVEFPGIKERVFDYDRRTRLWPGLMQANDEPLRPGPYLRNLAKMLRPVFRVGRVWTCKRFSTMAWPSDEFQLAGTKLTIRWSHLRFALGDKATNPPEPKPGYQE